MRDHGAVTSPTPGPRTSAPSAPRLIATDLDGTLLRDDKTVSPRTVAALAAAEEAGIEVFFVTGRPARWMDVVSDHVHGHGLAICGNGAAVVDLHGGPGQHRFVKIRELAVPDALDVVRVLRAAAPGTSFAVERTGGLHHEPTYPPLHLEPGESVAPAEKLLAEAVEGSAVADQPVLKLLAYHPELGPDAFLTLARTAVGDLAAVTRSSPSALLEISARTVSKASTLELCCMERGISPADVVAFGDMPNDMEMLAWAGTSYAMGNAHPDVLTAATGVTATNNEDGVARVIEDLLAARAAHRTTT
ncbi:HAD hydrolase family protein [Streptomyces sp. SID8379]|uniref:HAD hydrolase family protein n=1 Tax=unclassified Streptomyces TaxID=2593676 RepID=UPI0009980D9E|nr:MULTISPECIES: HAD hydrolase family protein [unclassified Streptomyces]MYW63939.1 HAD hydrolase family protein [Streptomyces sp. SID8379]